MAGTAEKSDPGLWDRVKAEVTAGDKGGRPGQWSARKAQIATRDYQRQGGGYTGARAADNHLVQWTEEEWGTKSGDESGETGERYLPKRAREHLSDADYARTTAKKRSDTADGRQFSAQPADIAARTARDREGGSGATRAELLRQAADRGIAGRSRMKKAELEQALRRPDGKRG